MRGLVLERPPQVLGGAVVTHMRGVQPADGNDLREAVHRAEWVREIDAYLRRDRELRSPYRASVPGNAYVVNTGAAAIALTAATARTLLYVNSGAANQPSFVELCVGFDGVTASAVPALVELCYGTAATNSTPGTNSTTFAPVQVRGWPVQTSVQTAANTIAVSFEPTVLVANKAWLVTPNGGLLLIQFPMGREPTGIATAATSGKQIAIRATAPAAVNARSYLEHEE